MMEMKGLCHICGKVASESCRMCGKMVCSDHVNSRQVCRTCAAGRRA